MYSPTGAGRERLWKCSACRHQTSLIPDTLFASTKLPLTRWFLTLHSAHGDFLFC
jgi:hypothetical protein